MNQHTTEDQSREWPACATYPALGCVCRGALQANKGTCTRKRTGDLTPVGQVPAQRPETDYIATLADERHRQGLSMGEVARRIGCSKSSIHAWEHGVKSPTLGNLLAWAHALNYAVVLTVPPEDFCGCTFGEGCTLPNCRGVGADGESDG